MLKLEHLHIRRRLEKLHLSFVDDQDEAHLRQAQEIIDAFEEAAALRWSRGEIEEWCASLARREKDGKFSSGAAKLLLDRAEFADEAEKLPELRRELLSRSATALQAAEGDYRRYRDMVRGANAVSDIYGDLPEFSKLEKCRVFSSGKELVDAYNLAQVQGVLLYAAKLRLEFSAPRPEELRPLLRNMRFHRLLAGAVKLSPELTVMEIDGPFSLLENSRKYALQLATFFPAVLAMPRWKLEAELKIDDRELKLELDDRAPLVPPRRRADYLPPEFSAFQKAFHDPEWELVDDAPAFLPDGDAPVIPDFTFRRKTDGAVVHLELFHRWHRAGLPRRLSDPEKLRRLRLLVGVDRALNSVADEFPDAENSGMVFRFRDFPGVETTLRALRKFPSAE